MKKAAEIMEVWEAVRSELRVLRGQNRFRGNEEHLLHRREVWLHFENRGGDLRSAVMVLRLAARMEDLTATRLPDGVEIKVAEFGGDWKGWLAAIVDQCRGGAYLHTDSGSAGYRKASQETNPESKSGNGTAA